ncbi:MAG TPA: hypothetical protein VFW76_13190 [Ktedonobacterales bacterium]|nr:hypothetical protein [Ktedonobacterales bacterium]
MEHLENFSIGPDGAPAGETDAASAMSAREWVCPGVSMRKRWITGVGVVLASALFFFIALQEGATMLVSTLIGVIFIGGFVGYLRVVAPKAFTIRLDDEGVTRTDRGQEPLTITWGNVAKIKEEDFPNGKPVSIAVFKRVGERGLHRAWVVYGDDIPYFSDFIAALHAGLPDSTPWLRETVHE